MCWYGRAIKTSYDEFKDEAHNIEHITATSAWDGKIYGIEQ